MDKHSNDDSVDYDEYILAMKRTHQRLSLRTSLPTEMQTPRERHRNKTSIKSENLKREAVGADPFQNVNRIGVIASMVPDEIIFKHNDFSIRIYETALMFIDVSGFTDLCENYTLDRGGPSRMTQVLNIYIGAMVQEILTHNGDVLKFSGDAFLSMWKKTSSLTMQDVVHMAIDCGLVIQKNYGTYVTDVGLVLKVKIAISAGVSHFSIIGGGSSSQSSYVIVGQPVWDVKMAEYLSTAGDVITSASAWMYVNEAEYCTQPCGDGKHTKVLGVGASWKRVENLHGFGGNLKDRSSSLSNNFDNETMPEEGYREFLLRPSLVAAIRSSWLPGLRQFMLTPVLRAVDNDEPLEFLTEVRRVVVVFFNIVIKPGTDSSLIKIVDYAYKCISSITSNSGGLVNKVSMFDKDMMFLVVFGLRGLKYENETQNALECALQCKNTLSDENIISVSVGVTSGTTYCGVIGHVLRREYTVIGPAVNKAARLMMAYPGKVTCDKETFLRSKLDQEGFKLMENKPLKGIINPGPIYEYDKKEWKERALSWRHPLLGRTKELQKYSEMLKNAIDQSQKVFTKYRDHKFAIAFVGKKHSGKTRLIEECLIQSPSNLRIRKINLNEDIKVPYGLFRLIISKAYEKKKVRSLRDVCENMIRFCVDITSATPTQIYAINTIFDCRFPLPETFTYTDDFLDDVNVKNILFLICKNNLSEFTVMAIDEAQHSDDSTWRILSLLLHWKLMFVVMTVTAEQLQSPTAKRFQNNHMVETVELTGVDRLYHAAIACQLLDVQAIPADLEKIIESASGGLPGWIQNFVISLVQRGALSVVTVRRCDIAGDVVVPSPVSLQHAQGEKVDDSYMGLHIQSYHSINSIPSETLNRNESGLNVVQDTNLIQMAILVENYNFDDLEVDIAMDVLILKTYDALTPFEKMLLKCASVLGDVFSRKMLLHLLQSDNQRTVAEAVAKLFAIRVLECEGGDFTRDTSVVLVHPAPAMHGVKPPYCSCLGTRQPVNCRDLPLYAFCGYMKFRHSLFRTTTYELLTENQKREMHARALMFLERYTRRCAACGAGCFIKIMGVRCDEGLIEESKELKRIREQICALNTENKIPGDMDLISPFVQDNAMEYKFYNTNVLPRYEVFDSDKNITSVKGFSSQSLSDKSKRVRSFSSLRLDNCECLSILLSVYCQIIDHCRGADEHVKLFEAYIEYTELSLLISNIPQAVRLLFEVENVVKTSKFYSSQSFRPWMIDYHLARIHSLRGVCMLESGDLGEARSQLLLSTKLYSDPFPTSKRMLKLRSIAASIRQRLALNVFPNCYVGTHRGAIGAAYDYIAMNHNRLYTLFAQMKETENAILAAKLALGYALRTYSNFEVVCVSYGNLIAIYRHKHNFAMCSKLEKLALDLCHRKRGKLDVTQIQAVCYLYTNIFQFYVEHGKKMKSLEFGMSVMHMMTSYIDLNTRQILVIWMLKLLLLDLRINDMVAIMREFFYMTDYYDLSSETWYYYYAMVILMDTGYSVETYAACEKFYITRGGAIFRSKTPEAAWNFFVAMWLMTIRVGAWEKSVSWEEKIKNLMIMKFEKHEYSVMILVRMVEGLIITLVKEMDDRNTREIILLQKTITKLFEQLKGGCQFAPMYKPRYYLLLAYYQYINGHTMSAFNYLNKATVQAKLHGHCPLKIWIEHTRNHWKGTLNKKYVNYWVEHVDSDVILDNRDFDPEKEKIIPFTLPLPREHDLTY